MIRIPWTKDRLLEGWQKRLYSRYGSWTVVTGASSGIGREIGYRLAEAGLNLVLVGRQRTLLEQMSTELANRHSI
ncbi:MAG: SDR family NAD(P)-dependent oxidoreductase, partial [Leptolyngbyaceae cyanobacterium SL_5_9]|nr:SDR family NAD(P)-dependent oxidoreductase [Leptolyngbyaceae cyanobacterium SL_5_9]